MAVHAVDDLVAPLLDYAIAVTGKEWERAYLYTAVSGLLSGFTGAAIVQVHGEPHCVLTGGLGEPFRFSPSTDGRIGNALQEAEHCDVFWDDEDWQARANDEDGDWTGDDANGDSILIAVCRAVLKSRVGDDIELPDGLIGAFAP